MKGSANNVVGLLIAHILPILNDNLSSSVKTRLGLPHLSALIEFCMLFLACGALCFLSCFKGMYWELVFFEDSCIELEFYVFVIGHIFVNAQV